MKQLQLFLIGLVICHALQLNAQSPQQITSKQLIGSWRCSQENWNLEYREGGVAIFNGVQSQYTLLCNNIIQYTYNGQKSFWQVALMGNTLTFYGQLTTYTYQRVSSGTSSGSNNSKGAGELTGQQLSQLLLSSMWCAMSYSKTSGQTWSDSYSTDKLRFFSDGTFSDAHGGENYNSGSNGTVYSDQSNGTSGKWQTLNGVLQMNCAETGFVWLTVPFELSHNSNGYPIIKINGTEFSQCN